MILFGDRVVCSTGDLVEAARCEFALLRALDAGLGLVAPVAYQSPGALPRPWDEPREHRLADLRDRFGSGVVRVRTADATQLPDRMPTAVAPNVAPHLPILSAHTPHTAGHMPNTSVHSPRAAGHTPATSAHTAAHTPTASAHSGHTAGHTPATSAHSPHTAGHTPTAAAHTPTASARSGHTAGLTPTTTAHSPHTAARMLAATPPPWNTNTQPPTSTMHPRNAGDGGAHLLWGATAGDDGRGEALAPATVTAIVEAAHEETLAALRAGAEAVASPVLFDGAFAVSCDFLLRDGAPESHDYLTAGIATRRTRITALLEQAACADALQRNGFRAAPHARLWLEGTPTTHTLADIAVVYRARRARLDLILDAKLNELLPVQWGDRRFLACGQCPACTAELESRRDLLLVAGMRPAVRAQLRDAGITTVDRLAAADVTVTGVPAPTFAALRRQAELQLHREHTGHPIYTVFDAAALAGLPAPSAGDLFVSVTTPGGQPSPDLLVTIGSGEPENIFRSFMIREAADRPCGESAAARAISEGDDSIALLDFLAEWQWNHPGLRIHHYRGGLRALLTDLADPHPDGEDIVAALLPLLVDLYPIVRAALLVGERSYALPHLPPNQFGPNEFDDAWPDDDEPAEPEDHDHDTVELHQVPPGHGHSAVAVLEHAVRTEIAGSRVAAPAKLDPAALADLAPTALAELAPAELAALDRAMHAALDPETSTELATSTGVDENLRAAPAELDPDTLAKLAPTTFADLTPATLADLDPSVLAELGSDALADLSPAALNQLRSAKLADLDPATLADLDPTALAELGLDALADLSPAALTKLRSAKLADLDPATLADLNPTALAKLGSDALADLSPAALTKLRSAKLADLDPATLADLEHGTPSELEAALDHNASSGLDRSTPTEFAPADDRSGAPPFDEECDARNEFVGDWVAVARLKDWLLELAEGHGIRPLGRPDPDVAEPPPAAIEAALREFADAENLGGTPRSGNDGHELHDAAPRDEARFAAAMTAAALGYHRRERQPLRWAHADRLDHPVEEWADTPGVLIADWGTVDTDWHSTIQRPMRRYITLTGRLGTGHAPPPGTPVVTLYDRPVHDLPAAPGRRALARATVLGCALDGNFDDVVRVVEFLPEGCEPYDELPSAIAPYPPSREEWLEDAIEDVAHELLVTLPEVPRTATFDILCRRTPRLVAGESLPEVFGDHAAAVTAAILDLDDSYVAVQGPPGTGKTDTAARAVERLVTRYKWRVGVVARSHKAVEHLLDAVVRVGVLPELVAKADARTVAPEWLGIEPDRYERFLDNAVNGCVVGGLPDDFVDPQRIPRESLDLLVIADAGRFPLTDSVAVTVSARNLLLVGDPAPATGHGAHPEPVNDSVLGWLVGPHRTLPAEYGYFLDRTWRMHPRMSGPVSRLRYDNRLRSNETVTLARELDGVPPGVRTITVEHHNNATESAEEAREVVRQVRTLLGLPWHTGAVTRRLHPHDILVVAPYHAQVARIRTLLSRARIEDVLVGTPDHFQGREAAVVLVSMTTSAPKDAPHGVAPLLSRHWLTSAISRAMWSAFIIRSPLLAEYLPTDTAELSDLAAFLQLDRV